MCVIANHEITSLCIVFLSLSSESSTVLLVSYWWWWLTVHDAERCQLLGTQPDNNTRSSHCLIHQVFKTQQHVGDVVVQHSLISVRITSKKGSIDSTGSQPSLPLQDCAWKSVFVLHWKWIAFIKIINSLL